MPVSQYAASNPGASDPWNIETTLASKAITSPAMAQAMLQTYQMQRQADTNVQADNLADAHAFNRQQLRQQLLEAQMKNVAELAGKPGGTQALASGVGGMGSAALGGDPAAWQQWADAGNASDQSKNFEAGGKGAEGFSNAGYMVPANAIPGMPDVPVTQTENVRLAAERLRANATLGAAAIHARAAGAAGGDVVTTQGEDAQGNPMTIRTKVPHGSTQLFNNNPGSQALPGVPPAPASTTSAPPVAAADTTDTSTPATMTNVPANNGAQGVAKAQQTMMANRPKWPTVFGADGAADIAAGASSNNNRPIIKPDPNKPGGMAVVGASGKHY